MQNTDIRGFRVCLVRGSHCEVVTWMETPRMGLSRVYTISQHWDLGKPLEQVSHLLGCTRVHRNKVCVAVCCCVLRDREPVFITVSVLQCVVVCCSVCVTFGFALCRCGVCVAVCCCVLRDRQPVFITQSYRLVLYDCTLEDTPPPGVLCRHKTFRINRRSFLIFLLVFSNKQHYLSFGSIVCCSVSVVAVWCRTHLFELENLGLTRIRRKLGVGNT